MKESPGDKNKKSATFINSEGEDNILIKNEKGLIIYKQKLEKLYYDHEAKDKKINETIKYGYSEKTKNLVPSYIILPFGLKKIVWDIYISIIIIYQLFIIPFDIGFNKECFLNESSQKSMLSFHLFVYICYMFDVILNFFTALINEKGEYEYGFEQIGIDYIRKMLIFDIATCIPLEIIISFNRSECFSSSVSINKILQFFSFVRFFKLKTLNRLIDKHVNAKMVTYVRLLKVLIFFYYMCHLIGCLITGTSQTLLKKLNVYLANNPNFSNFEKFSISYAYALFNGIYLILGNDISFETNSEKIIIIIVNVIALITNANVFGYVAMLLSNGSGNEGDTTLRTKLDHLNDFLNYQEVESELKKKINDYNILMFKRQRDLFYEEELFNDLPDCLKVEAKFQMWKGTYFVMDRLFANNEISSEFFSEAILKMKGKIFGQDERITYEGEQSMDFYLIPKGGKCNVSLHGVVVRELKQGDYFGEIAIWLKSQKRSASVTSLARSDYLVIQGKDFLSLLRNHPKEADIFKNVAKENFNRTIYMSRLSLVSRLIMNKNKVIDCFFKKNLYVAINTPNVDVKKYIYLKNRIQTKDLWLIHKNIKEEVDYRFNNGKIFNKKFKSNNFVKMLKIFIITHMEDLNYII